MVDVVCGAGKVLGRRDIDLEGGVRRPVVLVDVAGDVVPRGADRVGDTVLELVRGNLHRGWLARVHLS
jgi:hypothetical protein